MKSGANIFGAGRFAGVPHMPGKRKAAIDAAPQGASAASKRLLAMVHIAKKKLALSDDDYRAILLDVTGKRSAGDCTTDELGKVIDHFRARGWEADKPRGRSGSRRADHGPARKARAMWISLHALGAIDDASDTALEAFARRQINCTALQWADQGQMYKLIEALKAMAERNGWEQSLADVAPAMRVIVLKRRLVEAIMGKLWAAGSIPLEWDVQRAAYELAGIETYLIAASDSTLDIIARELGRVLRQTKGVLQP
jgi:phage gp16-like protein